MWQEHAFGRTILKLIEPNSGRHLFSKARGSRTWTPSQLRPLAAANADPSFKIPTRRSTRACRCTTRSRSRLRFMMTRAGSLGDRRACRGVDQEGGATARSPGCGAIRHEFRRSATAASASPARWPSNPSSSWPTSRSARSTCRSRRRSSTCSRTPGRATAGVSLHRP